MNVRVEFCEQVLLYGIWLPSSDKTISKDISRQSGLFHQLIGQLPGTVLPFFVLTRNYQPKSGKFELFVGCSDDFLNASTASPCSDPLPLSLPTPSVGPCFSEEAAETASASGANIQNKDQRVDIRSTNSASKNVPNKFFIDKRLTTFLLPAGQYGRITVKPKFGLFWGLSIGQAKRYFYQKWAPENGFRPLNLEYELHTLESVSRHPSIEIVFAVSR